MSKPVTVPCQYSGGQSKCGNKTTSHTGLCPKHRNSMPLKDIHNGIGGKPLMTAIPRVGPVVPSSLTYTSSDPKTNEELAEKILESEQREKYGNPSLLTRVLRPGKVRAWKQKLGEQKFKEDEEYRAYLRDRGHGSFASGGGYRGGSKSSGADTSNDLSGLNASVSAMNASVEASNSINLF